MIQCPKQNIIQGVNITPSVNKLYLFTEGVLH